MISLRKKILAFDEGMALYCSLEKDEDDIAITFAQSLYITVTKIGELLPGYLDDLARGECKEALGVDFDRMTTVAYWMKNGKLKSDMTALNDMTLRERGIEYAYKGFRAETTLDLYEAIEKKVAAMTEMLKEVEQRIKSAPPSLYGNFYRYQKSLCDRRPVEARYEQWKRESSVVTPDLLDDKQVQEVVALLKKKVMQHIKRPSNREIARVDLAALNEHMDKENQFPPEFPDCYVRFMRLVRVDGCDYQIDYDAYGRYLYDFFNLLTADERQALIELDLMLDLIHEDMASLRKVVLPEPLATPEARVLWRKAQDAGLVDERYQPKLSLTESAVLASWIAAKLELQDRWKYFELLWHRKNMRSHYCTALSQQKTYEFQKSLDTVLG